VAWAALFYLFHPVSACRRRDQAAGPGWKRGSCHTYPAAAWQEAAAGLGGPGVAGAQVKLSKLR